MQSAFQLPNRARSVVVIGTEDTAPAAATVMAQSPALQGLLNSFVIVAVKFATDDQAADFEIAIRSAANEDISVMLVTGAELPGLIVFWMQAVNTDYIQVRAKTAGTSAKLYQASINAWIY
jgi:hypothetical protein